MGIFQNILKNDAQPQIQHQKHAYRQQCLHIAFFHYLYLSHLIK